MDFLTNLPQLPSIGPFAPPSGAWGTGLATLQCLMVLTAGFHEVQNPTPYSKFAMSGKNFSTQVPSRVGMFLLYAPSAILAILTTASPPSWAHSSATLASWLVALHFGKRVMEVLFLHKYSGHMDLVTSISIGFYYALVSALIMYTAAPMDRELFSTDDHTFTPQRLGLGLCLLGEIGNFYHHYLLRQLRSNSTNKKEKKQRYIPPTGGLFRFVAAPHYLFEVIAFLGIALSAQSLHALLVALSMGSYLTGRAVLTKQFYQKTFDYSPEWQTKKAIVPFVF